MCVKTQVFASVLTTRMVCSAEELFTLEKMVCRRHGRQEDHDELHFCFGPPTGEESAPDDAAGSGAHQCCSGVARQRSRTDLRALFSRVYHLGGNYYSFDALQAYCFGRNLKL